MLDLVRAPLTERQCQRTVAHGPARTDVLPAMAVAVRPPPDVTADQLAEGPERSLGSSLTKDIQLRATTTATAAGAAWLLARPVSTPGQAGTIGLVALRARDADL